MHLANRDLNSTAMLAAHQCGVGPIPPPASAVWQQQRSFGECLTGAAQLLPSIMIYHQEAFATNR